MAIYLREDDNKIYSIEDVRAEYEAGLKSGDCLLADFPTFEDFLDMATSSHGRFEAITTERRFKTDDDQILTEVEMCLKYLNERDEMNQDGAEITCFEDYVGVALHGGEFSLVKA